MKADFRSIVLSALLLSVLGACASSPPVRYYSLDPIDTQFQEDPDDAIMLGLGPIRMPDYLNRSQIVWRGESSAVMVDEFSHWSEPLATSMLRVVSADVDNLIQGVVVVVFPYEPFVRDQVDYRLIGDVHRFETDPSGRVTLEVQWGIADRDGGTLVPVRRNRYQTQAGTPGDLDSVVAAMNDAVAQFSRDIVQRMQSVL